MTRHNTWRSWLGVALGGLGLAVAGCAKESSQTGFAAPISSAAAAPAIPTAAPASGSVSAKARQAVAAGAALVDVRTPEEFADGHIAGAINLPVDELAARAGELAAGRELVVYCRSGNRSRRATALLRERGHAVIDLGPMSAW